MLILQFLMDPGVQSAASPWEWLLNSVLVVLLVSVAAAQFIEFRENDRLRRATREALANEFRVNLEILDQYEQNLSDIALGTINSWSYRDLYTLALGRTLEPATVALLSDSEQVHLTLLELAILELRRFVQQFRATAQDNSSPDNFADQQGNQEYIRELAATLRSSEELAATGAALVGAIVAVLLEQGEFILSPSIEMATTLELLITGVPIGAYLWRSSDLRRWPPSFGVLVFWRNDDPQVIPAGRKFFEFYSGGQYTFATVDRESSHHLAPTWLAWRRFWIRHGIRRSSKRLAKNRQDGVWP